MDERTKGQPKLKIVSYERMKLGVKAAVACYLGGQEKFKDEVQLWKARNREAFIQRCMNNLDQDLTPRQEKELRDQLDKRLRNMEIAIKTNDTNSKSDPEQGKPKEMSEEERKEATDLLKDEDLLERVREDLTKMGIVDEEKNKVLIYLIATSRKMQKGLAATIKGSSSAGKNHLVNSVSILMPQEEVKEFTRISSKALAYVGETALQNKLLICTEVVGKEEAEYLLRAFISEGEISSLTTVRSHEGGPFQTQEFRVKGPFAYVDTTTNFILHPENATRVFELYLNEGANQTKDILQQQAKEAGPDAFQIKAEREQIKRVHQNAQRLLRSDLDVIIPFSHLIDFPPENIRARRDFPKLLNLIKVIANLHQIQREIIHQGDKECIVATLVDYELAYHLVKDTFVETLDDLDKRSRDVLQTVVQKVEELAKQKSAKVENVVFDRDMITEWYRRPKNKLNPAFKELEEQGYFHIYDDDLNPIESGSITTKKRNYRLNTGRLYDRPILADLTTPEQLRKKLEGQARKAGQVETEKPLENKELSNLSHLSPLSPPMEEKK